MDCHLSLCGSIVHFKRDNDYVRGVYDFIIILMINRTFLPSQPTDRAAHASLAAAPALAALAASSTTTATSQAAPAAPAAYSTTAAARKAPSAALAATLQPRTQDKLLPAGAAGAFSD